MSTPASTPPSTLAPTGTLTDALPPGWSVRPLEPPRDDDAVLALVEAYERGVREHRIEPAHEVLDQLRALPGGGALDVLVVCDEAAEVSALLPWEVDTAEAEPPLVWFDVYLHPTVTGPTRSALEAALLRSALARTRSWATAAGRTRVRARTGTYRRDTGLVERIRRVGMAHERTFFGMVVELHAGYADPGPAPDGVRVRAVPPGQARTVHDLIEQTFADHWSHHREEFAQWWRRRSTPPAYDPCQWWVAEAGGAPVGVCLGDASRAGLGGGFVRNLGVVRAARGTGIAKHLLRVAFAEHRRRGWSWTSLGVDADSPTGATHLYRSVGMREVDTVDVYRVDLEVDPSANPQMVAEPTTRVPS